MNLERAIEVFGEGFRFARARTTPSEFIRDGRVWMIRDAAPRSDGPRRTEVISLGASCGEVFAEMRRIRPEKPIFGVVARETDLKSAELEWKSAGCRIMAREPFFVRRFDAPPSGGSSDIRVLQTQEELELLAKAKGQKPRVLSELTGDSAKIHQLIAWKDGVPIGWVALHPIDRDAWVSDLWVNIDQRGQGIGFQLMAELLALGEKSNLDYAVLLSSKAGSKLYPRLGFEQIGTLLLMAPPKDADWL